MRVSTRSEEAVALPSRLVPKRKLPGRISEGYEVRNSESSSPAEETVETVKGEGVRSSRSTELKPGVNELRTTRAWFARARNSGVIPPVFLERSVRTR